MRGLTVLCARADRLGTAVELIGAQAALGGSARLFLTGDVPGALARTGEQTMGLADCIALGARIIICQSALAVSGVTLDALAGRLDMGDGAMSAGLLTGGGLIGLMAGLGDDRLLTL